MQKEKRQGLRARCVLCKHIIDIREGCAVRVEDRRLWASPTVPEAYFACHRCTARLIKDAVYRAIEQEGQQ